ncbi:MAG: branched-chain amino acid ABC transporter permease [Humidesulfovibrio sp.]|jgi:branched-chain amino acid transport system permease protein|uniref:ABC transporter permease subunit n=1 Tax=Humidesulfovibrio sp. TaxID=2910988 RepID=UPI00273641D5|nr:branched-chain amino acid ABC transporter permease [Humidesulfovibrio sp.]MDP2848693.1 branched-chain amino acid ABC transporter permease [Humidesulfovibrio sp.]
MAVANLLGNLKKSAIAALWLAFLTLPVMVIRVDTVEKTVTWRWMHLAYMLVGSFVLAVAWHFLMDRRDRGAANRDSGGGETQSALSLWLENPSVMRPLMAFGLLVAVAFPWVFSMYQTNILISALIYVVLGLGLNITVGLAGLLDLGYVAFYAVGAYAYALLNHHFQLGFWTVLPLGAILGAFFGILLGFPVLRLRGDYLAIVTLGFGQIVRLVLENWSAFSNGPAGISNISRPGLFGVTYGVDQATTYIYYIMLALVVLTIFVTARLKDSRIGRAWLALREDEIACQAMGIDNTRAKLMAFALGATLASLMGVVFAAKTTYINPASFTFMESAMILAIVVLGGMGSVLGVILGAFLLILLPEYMRAFSEYRMLIFGATMILVMVFRPQGLIRAKRKVYKINTEAA